MLLGPFFLFPRLRQWRGEEEDGLTDRERALKEYMPEDKFKEMVRQRRIKQKNVKDTDLTEKEFDEKSWFHHELPRENGHPGQC